MARHRSVVLSKSTMNRVNTCGFYALILFYTGYAWWFMWSFIGSNKSLFEILLIPTIAAVINGFIVYPFCVSICGRTENFVLNFKHKIYLLWSWKITTFVSWIIALYELFVIAFGLILTVAFS